MCANTNSSALPGLRVKDFCVEKNGFDFVEVTPMLKEKRMRIAQQPDA